MVSKKEIEDVARLMRIELSDHTEHVEQVQKMLAYFEILDRAGVEDGDITSRDLPLDQLRQDEHLQYPDRLIGRIHNYKGTYVRAPKMM